MLCIKKRDKWTDGRMEGQTDKQPRSHMTLQQWGTYTPDQRYRHFLKSTKYVALTLEIAVVCYML